MLRRYFIAGLLIWVPLWVTFLLIRFFADLMDQIFLLLPDNYQPDNLLGFHIPGLGIIVTVLVVFFTGLLLTNVIGKYLIAIWEGLLARIPIVRSIYSGVKQTMNSLVSSSGQSFRKVLLVKYPHTNAWTVALQTGAGFPEAAHGLQQDLVTVFVPTTPNPTAGFVLLVPRQDTIELSLTVDEALKYIISLGVIIPATKNLPIESKIIK